MLALNEIELKRTRFYQKVVEEGRQEAEQILLQRMLTRLFGEVTDCGRKSGYYKPA